MITSHIELLLKTLARKEDMCDPGIEIKPGKKKGDGFLGDIFMATLSSNGKKLEIILKCAMTDQEIIDKYHLKEVYDNEKYFYSVIFPTIQKFQEDNRLPESFKSVAKYYGSLFEDNIRIIALENLRTSGFELFDKKGTVDGKHVEKVFKEYGKLHGAFFAYKYKHPEEFGNLTGDLHDCWRLFSNDDSFNRILEEICKEVTTLVINLDKDNLIQRFKKYTDDVRGVYQEVATYEGQYATLNHGDCWTNNFMFKYKDLDGAKSLEDLRILDWQITRLGTPVYDLSYFLYSSSSKQILDHLDNYLDIYYDTLSRTIDNLGCKPQLLYPYSVLKSEWKKYSGFGFLLGLILHRMKLTNNDEIIDLHDVKNDDPENTARKFNNTNFDRETFNERAISLVLHMYDIDAL